MQNQPGFPGALEKENHAMTPLTQNASVLSWIQEKADLVKPDQIVWIDGSEEQIEALRKDPKDC